MPAATTTPVLSIHGATAGFGTEVLWSNLDLDIGAGEIVAVLGANGTGKSTLFRAILGQLSLRAGSIQFLGEPIHGGDRRIGYIPQQHLFRPGTPMRGRDLVRLGVDGTRIGHPFASRATRAAVEALLDEVGASAYANRPIGELSGGEQQRLRVAQALTGDPQLLICDEPYASLDVRNQEAITQLIVQRRDTANTPVLFITHDINPVLPYVDRVLYLAGGGHRLGRVEEILNTEALSDLFGSPAQVVHVGDQIFVVGSPDRHHHDAAASTLHGNAAA